MPVPRSLPALSLSAIAVAAAFAADPAKPDAAKLPPPAAGKIDFDRDVRPILAAHCFKCHGPEKQKGGLRLDDRKAALQGGNGGAVIFPGTSADSRLVHAVAGTDPDAKMPPEGPSLSAGQVGQLRAWIDQGAGYGTQAGPQSAGPAKSTHWAFQPIRRPAVPVTRDPKTSSHVRNSVDSFVLARLEKEGLNPSPEADRATLLRRVSLDLTGLPPPPAEVDAFLADAAPDAYEKVVDRLLASPHYGERWGRHWLDSARYADSDGYEKDTGRPFAWRYRDWMIGALNADLPFDRFTTDQLAGDLLPDATVDQKIATGFHRNTLTNKEGGVDQEEFRVAACVDRVNTTGKVWLGLTVGCAQCHDHKYDPISQREFYQLFAFFNSDRELDIDAPLASEREQFQARQAAFDAEKAKLRVAVEEARVKKLPAAELAKREKAQAAHAQKAPTPAKAMTLAAGPPRPTHVMLRGDFLRKGVEVKPGTLAVLHKPAAGGTRLDLARWLTSQDNPLTARVTVNWVWAKYFGRGLVSTPEDFGTQGDKPTHPELLDWLASEFKDPAPTPPSFPGKGVGGAGSERNPSPGPSPKKGGEEDSDSAPPSFPGKGVGGSGSEKGIGSGAWSLKRLHKLIVTSATYRQSSAVTPDLIARDPLNVLLARQSRLRLEAEIVRDEALAASGLLTRTVGGPSVRPPQPPGISELTYANSVRWVESTGPDRYKRGLYIWFQRTSPYPMLMTFDGPDSNVCVVRRERSNTPLQALALLNDAVFVECAQALAKRVLAEMKDAPAGARADLMFRLCLGREPAGKERDRLLKLVGEFRELAAANPAEAAKLVGQYKVEGVAPAEAAAWVALGRTLLNLDEFVTRE
ncbi:MAG: hypothetical protein JWO38_597 [Gemmataceae bacterium]|nr:hypothetical protein [Gemmataceae bacterium]